MQPAGRQRGEKRRPELILVKPPWRIFGNNSPVQGRPVRRFAAVVLFFQGMLNRMASKLRPAVTFVCLLGSPALYGAEDTPGTTQPDTDSGAQTELTQLNAEAQDGYRIGGFTVRPEVAVSGIYDSNIFATPTDEVEDSIMLFAPTLAADSGWARHKLEFDLGGAFARYSSNDDEDYDDYWASTDGRYDLSDNTNLFGGLGYSHEHEDRGSPEDEQAGDEPTVYDSSRAHAGISHDWGKLGVRLGGTYEDLKFDDAGTLNNSDRDRALTGAGGRVSWQLHPQYSRVRTRHPGQA